MHLSNIDQQIKNSTEMQKNVLLAVCGNQGHFFKCGVQSCDACDFSNLYSCLDKTLLAKTLFFWALDSSKILGFYNISSFRFVEITHPKHIKVFI